MLCIFQRQLQHCAGRGCLLRVNPRLQVILKPGNAGFNFCVAGAALFGRHQPL